MPQVHLVVRDLAFAYPGRPVFEGVTFRVPPGGRLGVVGENASGKSTLLGVLAGRLAPTVGEVRTAGRLAVVEQELDPAEGLTVGDLVQGTLREVRETAAALDAAARAFDHGDGDGGDDGTDAAASAAGLAELTDLLARAEHLEVWDADRRVDVALTRLGASRDPDRRLDEMSVGERYRVRLACRLAERSDVLLLDEPTNHLDDAAVAFLTAELQAWRGIVVVVTHDRQLLDDVATAILDLDPGMDGHPVLYGQPGYLSYRFAKTQALHRWRQRWREEQKRAERLAARLDASYEGLSDEWRPEKGSQKNRRATRARIHVKAADRLVQKLEAEAVEVPTPPLELVFPDLVAMSPGWDPSASVVELRNPRVSAGASAPADARPRLDLAGTRIAVPPSGRLLVVGPNGSGKSTLLGALAGTVPLARGTRTVVDGARVGTVGQEESVPVGLRMGDGRLATGFDAYAREALDLLAAGALDPELLVPVAALGLLTEDDLDRPLAELSVGQRRRFEIARALLAVPHVLILDEPTNHLSIDLVDELTRALQRTSAAVVVATHDRRLRDDLGDWPTLTLA
ncbi:ABC-F family ATP-binding cassette domain-containing protein [Luteimicrobium subarcticum]|uniref:Macrolide transport system ATP-binding/permease protein n=1 Tax=Luteimicrobium subarcticum TaxID=620910 RepID=A0A2M8WRZ6_9MICO|nr:ATP-binding cassette domain-containing protein [Luteimicrobium subarcticum]PJI93606.1 macrolide transport system ATP-binding/permease protein [Luteimicrobium subarcticum]